MKESDYQFDVRLTLKERHNIEVKVDEHGKWTYVTGEMLSTRHAYKVAQTAIDIPFEEPTNSIVAICSYIDIARKELPHIISQQKKKRILKKIVYLEDRLMQNAKAVDISSFDEWPEQSGYTQEEVRF